MKDLAVITILVVYVWLAVFTREDRKLYRKRFRHFPKYPTKEELLFKRDEEIQDYYENILIKQMDMPFKEAMAYRELVEAEYQRKYNTDKFTKLKLLFYAKAIIERVTPLVKWGLWVVIMYAPIKLQTLGMSSEVKMIMIESLVVIASYIIVKDIQTDFKYYPNLFRSYATKADGVFDLFIYGSNLVFYTLVIYSPTIVGVFLVR